jgi:phosphate transport system substrate-binding protein
MTRNRVFILLAVAIGTLASIQTWYADAQAPGENIVRVKGSDTMANRVDDAAGQFMKQNPDITVVVSGGGSGIGIKALIRGNAEVAMASRPITPREQAAATEANIEVARAVVGRDAIAMITHPANPVDHLTVEEIQKIFTGQIANWADVGGHAGAIVLYAADHLKHGTAALFLKRVLHGAPLDPETTVRPDFRAVLRDVSYNEKAIGYSPLIKALKGEQAGEVKILGLKTGPDAEPVKPTPETLANESYPYLRSLNLYYDGRNATPQTRSFVGFCEDKEIKLD